MPTTTRVRRPPSFVLAFVLAALALTGAAGPLARPARAADQTILGSKLTVKDGGTAAKRLVLVSAKEKGSANTLVGDPTMDGAVLEVMVGGTFPSSQAFVLPQGTNSSGAAFWIGSTGSFTYRDSAGDNGPVSSVQVQISDSGIFQMKVKISGKNGNVDVLPPAPGTDGCVALSIDGGDRYSASFGPGSDVTNSGAQLFSAKTPDAEAECDVVPTTTTTTTTTLPHGPWSTAGVECSYSSSVFNADPSVNATSTATWSCASTTRSLAANGLPDHDVGTFPNPACPNTIAAQVVSRTFSLSPSILASNGSSTNVVGYGRNGVKFDPGTAGTCDNSGSSCSLVGGSGAWKIEALGQSSFDFGVDSNNAHVQPGGAYHYHGMPETWLAQMGGGTTITLVGWSVDGFPIYARYGYTDALDNSSSIKAVTGSWQLQASPDANRPSTSLYPMGTFQQDWEYVAGSGDLDQCNGRYGVTPEFPAGIYHYYITDTYPYIQRCVKGSTGSGTAPPS